MHKVVGKRKSLDNAILDHPKFSHFRLDKVANSISRDSRYVTFHVRNLSSVVEYSWMLEVPAEVYKKIGKDRFTGQEILDIYPEKE